MILKPRSARIYCAATCSGVAFDDVPGDRVDTGAGVPLQGADGASDCLFPQSGECPQPGLARSPDALLRLR